MNVFTFAVTFLATVRLGSFAVEAPGHLSGIYPGLAMFNNKNECGTSAVVP